MQIGKKRQTMQELPAFKSGAIGNILEELFWIGDLEEGTQKVSAAECEACRKQSAALKAEIRNCRYTWEKDSTLETALGDVLAVTDRFCANAAALSEEELTYGFMGRIQGLFFVKYQISSHTPSYYTAALEYFTEQKQSVENAVALEKRNRSELSYDKIGNAEAMEKAAATIRKRLRQVKILEDMLHGVQEMIQAKQTEQYAVENCDREAEEQKEMTEEEPLFAGEEKCCSQSLEDAIPDVAEKQEEKTETTEQYEEAEKETEKKKHRTIRKEKRYLSRFRRNKELPVRTEETENCPKVMQSAEGHTLSAAEWRPLLFAEELILFTDKKGTDYIGKKEFLTGSHYDNSSQSAYRISVSCSVKELLTVKYEPSFSDGVCTADFSQSFQIMKWIFQTYIGDVLSIRQYAEYQSYYNVCAETFLQEEERRQITWQKANLTAAAAARFVLLFRMSTEETTDTLCERYTKQILDGETEELEHLIEEIVKEDISEKELKEKAEELKKEIENPDTVHISYENLHRTGTALSCSKAEAAQEAWYGGSPAAVYGITAEERTAEGDVIDERFLMEARNVRLLLKKESVNGDIEIKSASFQNMPYLVKQFYIMLSYVKELGVEYNGEQIWLIRYDTEQKLPVPAISPYEKHIRRLDKGKTGGILHYVENRYFYLLQVYADFGA